MRQPAVLVSPVDSDTASARGCIGARREKAGGCCACAAVIRADMSQAQSLGIGGTPSFLLAIPDAASGKLKPIRLITGARPFSSFEKARSTRPSPTSSRAVEGCRDGRLDAWRNMLKFPPTDVAQPETPPAANLSPLLPPSQRHPYTEGEGRQKGQEGGEAGEEGCPSQGGGEAGEKGCPARKAPSR